MSNLHKIRESNKSLIKEVRSSVAVSSGEDLVVPDGCWDILITYNQGNPNVLLVNRPLVGPALVPHVAGQEMLIITFAPGVFVGLALPQTATGMLSLPLASKNKFWLGPKAVEIPTFSNAEAFGEDLRRKGFLTSDKIVTQALIDGTTVHERARQRHFKRITGMTLAYFKQVERAHAAARQLQRGTPILQVAHDQGYSDQFHLAKSLRRILGQTPSSLRRGAN